MISIIIAQFIFTISLIFGVSLGSYIASEIFGKPKKWYLSIIEYLIFVFILLVMFETVMVAKLNPFVISFIILFLGLISAITSRAIITGLGLISIRTQQKFMFEEEDMEDKSKLIGLVREIKKIVPNDKVIEIFYNAGFRKSKIKEIIDFIEELKGNKGTK